LFCSPCIYIDTHTCTIHVYAHMYVYSYMYICIFIHLKYTLARNNSYLFIQMYMYIHTSEVPGRYTDMGWLRLAGSLKLQVSFAKEPYETDDILQKRPIIIRSLLIEATTYIPQVPTCLCVCAYVCACIYLCVCVCVCVCVCITI